MFLFGKIENRKVGCLAFRMQLAQFRVWRLVVFSRIDIVGASRQQQTLGLFDVFASNVAIGCRWNQQRQAPGPQNDVEIMPDLTDVFRFFVISSRYSDPGFFHFLDGCAFLEAARYRTCASPRACIRSRSWLKV